MTVALGGNIMGGGNLLTMLAPHPRVTLVFGASGAMPVFG